MRCPICKQPVERGSDYRPFCSERCKLIDLDNWFSGRYRIASPDRERPDRSAQKAGDDLVENLIEGDSQ